MSNLTYIEGHVVADALASWGRKVEGGMSPWADYTGNEDDTGDPASEAGYRAAIVSATAVAIAAVEQRDAPNHPGS